MVLWIVYIACWVFFAVVFFALEKRISDLEKERDFHARNAKFYRDILVKKNNPNL